MDYTLTLSELLKKHINTLAAMVGICSRGNKEIMVRCRFNNLLLAYSEHVQNSFLEITSPLSAVKRPNNSLHCLPSD